MNILITGINGYLGSHLAKALSKEHKIFGLEYSLENLSRITDCNYQLYAAKDGISDNVFSDQQIDAVIHTATFYGRNDEDYLQMFHANLHSPLSLLDLAISHKCKLFINTDTVLDRFVSTYALTKRQFQEWLYLRRNEIKVINMQLEHFFGPDASPTNFITFMMNKLKNNEPFIDLTLGEQQRDFIFVDDVVNAYLTVIEKEYLIPDSYSSFQVCSNQLISIKDLLILMKNLTKSNSILNFGSVPYRENELMYSTADNKNLIALGWSPMISVKEGIQKMIDEINFKDKQSESYSKNAEATSITGDLDLLKK